jgi:hypothetical protein
MKVYKKKKGKVLSRGKKNIYQETDKKLYSKIKTIEPKLKYTP